MLIWYLTFSVHEKMNKIFIFCIQIYCASIQSNLFFYTLIIKRGAFNRLKLYVYQKVWVDYSFNTKNFVIAIEFFIFDQDEECFLSNAASLYHKIGLTNLIQKQNFVIVIEFSKFIWKPPISLQDLDCKWSNNWFMMRFQ